MIVNTPNGNAPLASGFTYTPPVQPPTANSINPASGSTLGGTPFTITGTNLTGATSVTFNGVPVAVTVGAGGTTVSGVTPAGTAGNATVIVNTPNGNAPLASGFTYTPPQPATATGITPASGSTLGGTPFVITGTNLVGTTSVTFNGAPVAVTVGADGTSLTGVTPAGTAGNATVVVKNPNGDATVPGGYSYTAPVAPVLNSVAPRFSPSTGGNTVNIYGSGFTGATQVSFNGVPATFTVVSPTQIVATAPAGTGSAQLRVSGPGGTSNILTFEYRPFLTGIVPTFGQATGGTTVTLYGTNLSEATNVRFGTTNVSFTVVSDDQIVAISPPGTGTVQVQVTTPGGSSNPIAFAYGPDVQLMAPAFGPAGGGNTVVFTGVNLTGTNSVLFGTQPATNINVLSDTQVSVTAPAGTNNVNVTLFTPGGSDNAGGYFYAPFVNASSISAVSGGSITITGANFTGATQVNFGNIASPSITVINDSTIIATIPAGLTGVVPVTVAGPGGTSSGSAPYRATPFVSSLSPSFGPAGGTNTVTLSGVNFTGATGVFFGTTPATSFTILSDSQISATAPSGSGSVNVSVQGPGGTSPVLSGSLYNYAPAVSGVVPAAGPVGGPVTITGTNLSGATGVLFGTTPATSFTILSDTQIIATPPAGLQGPANVTVQSAGGTSNAGTFTYAPVVSSVAPGAGSAGTPVTITGTNLSGATGVFFGTTPAASFTILSDTQIIATPPVGLQGPANVTVQSAGGTSNAGTFTYAPVLTAAVPNTGPVSGGNSVTLNGSNLAGVTSVMFGTTPAASFRIISPTQIVAVAPPGVSTAQITATGPGGTSNVVFYNYTPTLISLVPASGPSFGGNTIIINGNNLTGASAVTFADVPAPSFTVLSDTQIEVVVPPNTGRDSVVVYGPGGASNGLTYTYLP
ncbi:beta strand repeat-containing protein [Streptomyces kronopolitis]|uniref:beta strand repeat-containing protein n=1 Tax=Streptomyces kronopolitis TaxID=1612435 RepID=UPI00343E90FF